MVLSSLLSNYSTPLHLAAGAGYHQVLDQLLAEGTDVACKNAWGATALHYAAAAGQDVAVRRLIAQNAPIDMYDTEGCTPLHIAAFQGHSLVARTLKSHGACVTMSDRFQMTPPQAAAASGSLKIARMLAGLKYSDVLPSDNQESSDNGSSAAFSMLNGMDKEGNGDLFGSMPISGDKQTQALAAALLTNKSIRTLDCSNCNFSDSISLVATSLEHNTTLRWLSLDTGVRSLDQLVIITQSLELNVGLNSLDLSGARFGPAGFRAISHLLQQTTSLRQLAISNAVSNAVDAATLAVGLAENTSVDDILLHHSRFADTDPGMPSGLRYIRTALSRRRGSLARLGLAASLVTVSDARELAGMLYESRPALLVLDIRGDLLSIKGKVLLATALKTNLSLRGLRQDDTLRECVFAARRVFVATGALVVSDKELVNLDLDGCLVDNGEITQFVDALRGSTSLKSLSIANNKLDKRATEALMLAIGSCQALSSLNLRGCLKTNDHAILLANTLRNNNTLLYVNARDSGYGVIGIKALASALRHNMSLVKLGCDKEAGVTLLPLVYLNSNCHRLDPTDQDTLRELLFDSITLRKYVWLPALFQAGALPEWRRPKRSGTIPEMEPLSHSLLFQHALHHHESFVALVDLFRRHWEIDMLMSRLLNEKANWPKFQMMVAQLATEDWRDRRSNNILHHLVNSCHTKLLDPRLTADACRTVLDIEKRRRSISPGPAAALSLNEAMWSPAEIAMACPEQVRRLFQEVVVDVVAGKVRGCNSVVGEAITVYNSFDETTVLRAKLAAADDHIRNLTTENARLQGQNILQCG